MKIMHGLSEVAGQNHYAVKGLKEIGEKADTVVWMPNAFNYPYDINLNIDKNKKQFLPYYILKLITFFLKSLVTYDTFHFHYGRSILFNKELFIYKLLNKRIVYEFHGSDLRNLELAAKKNKYMSSLSKANSKSMNKNLAKIFEFNPTYILHDDELVLYLPHESEIFVVPLKIDLDLFDPVYPEENSQTIKIVHAPSSRATKGTKEILQAFDELKKQYKNIELVLVEGKTQEEAVKIYQCADIIIDQIRIGTYGVFSIESMAMGKPVVAYITQEMKAQLPEDLPIISASPDTIKEMLEELIIDGKRRRQLGVMGRKYVESYHDYRKAAKMLVKIYKKQIAPLQGREAFSAIKKIEI